MVRRVNSIANPSHKHTSVHLHGNASLPQYDGYASDMIRPGEYKDYRYPNDQDARTLWYHDHGVHDTARNAYMGCAAFYITRDAMEQGLPIPHGPYDVPLVLRDAMFAKDGRLIFDDQGRSTLMGDVILADGAPWPAMEVEKRKYRFRVLNAAVSRSFDLALSTGEPMTVIGTDGGLMPAPVETPNLRVGMAERYEVVIGFEKYGVGRRVLLENRQLPNNVPYANTDVVMRFDVAGEAKDARDNSVPAVLNPSSEVMRLEEAQADPARTARLDLVRQNGIWTVNGRSWHDVEASGFKEAVADPRVNEVRVWELTNNSNGWFHPLHVHLIDFRIPSRTGGRVPGLRPYEKGPKDTVYLGEGEKVRVLARFGPNEGRYMVHCHNLVHEDHDMMAGPTWEGPTPTASSTRTTR